MLTKEAEQGTRRKVADKEGAVCGQRGDSPQYRPMMGKNRGPLGYWGKLKEMRQAISSLPSLHCAGFAGDDGGSTKAETLASSTTLAARQGIPIRPDEAGCHSRSTPYCREYLVWVARANVTTRHTEYSVLI